MRRSESRMPSTRKPYAPPAIESTTHEAPGGARFTIFPQSESIMIQQPLRDQHGTCFAAVTISIVDLASFLASVAEE